MGLPGAGKTVVFNALSLAKVPVATYSAPSTVPNQAVVKVPDARLAALAELFHPRKVTPAEVRYVDVAGLTQGAGRDGQAGQHLAYLRNSDALLIVVRAFASDVVAHPLGPLDPQRDLEVISTELLLADLGVVEKRLERLEKEVRLRKGTDAEQKVRAREYALLQAMQRALIDGKPARSVALDPDDETLLRGYCLLTQKPWLVLLNAGDGGAGRDLVERVRARWEDERAQVAAISGRLEMELAELPPQEADEFRAELELTEPALEGVIQASYRLLDLISYFTVGEDEVRAWTLKRGANAVEAASVIHTSIARAFIRAEVIGHDELLACGSLAEARKRGLLRSEGRNYVFRDGDVAQFLHNG
ncbi:MAG: redox-regulated ATPase YchF [Bacteroidetes bacterium]|nr:redox-regulated ATPase YchF [Bacteroidota bacterium]MCL5025030.1 redox-regulated ATPase YchF [Chloroflexota bacterium]